jgi:large subunit ribosomal protein L25
LELFELKANIREKTGKGPARVLRSNESVPAVLYGPGIEPVKLTIDTKMVENAFKQKSNAQVFVNLTVTDNNAAVVKTCPGIIKEVQLSPLSKELLHVDIMEIDLNKKVRIKVPVETVGKAKGVEYGGLLQVIRRELEVLCIPLDTPDKITIDVSGLDMGDSIHVKDLSVDRVEIPADVNFTVITVIPPKTAGKADDAAA